MFSLRALYLLSAAMLHILGWALCLVGRSFTAREASPRNYQPEIPQLPDRSTWRQRQFNFKLDHVDFRLDLDYRSETESKSGSLLTADRSSGRS